MKTLLTLLGTALLLASTCAFAQQKVKYSFKSPDGVSKYTAQHALDVGDVPGHQVRIAQLTAQYGSEAPEYDGVKAVEEVTSITSDYINGSGSFRNYAVMTMANGDKIFSVTVGTTQTTFADDGSRKGAFSTVTTLTGGTGKFAKLRGILKGGGTSDFKTGVNTVPTEGEYWFEK